MRYPDDVLTKSKNGRAEVRVFLKRGMFVEYGYMDADTGKIIEKKKIILKSDENMEAYFIVPLKQKNKFLMIKEDSVNVNIKLWDGKKSIGLWGD